MPPRNPLDQLLGRNPARQFATSSEVSISRGKNYGNKLFNK